MEKDPKLMNYVPISKRDAIESIYHDEYGYWAYVENGYKVKDYYTEHTIYEDNLKEFRRIFKYIVKEIDNMSNLKELRLKAELSQAALSEASGVNVRMIQYYEQGVKDLNKANGETLYKLARSLGCTMEDLLDKSRILYDDKQTF